MTQEKLDEAKRLYETANSDQRYMLETLFPELKESEDERIRKVLLNDFKNNCSEYYCEGVNRDMIIAWLEKQGEQKPNDKVEPKFKVGDWITDGKALLHIAKFETDYGYELKSIDGEVFHFISPNFVEANYHLWTIEDAKDGDVLAAHECVVLFKEIDGLNIKCHCTYHFMNNPSFYVNTLQNKSAFHPATKEQRNLLFQGIKEAGYEWNAEKKELKKIEQEPTWSEEDEVELNGLIKHYEDGHVSTPQNRKTVNWLKSLNPQNSYNSYKATIESIAEMCNKYENLMWDETEARDFLVSIKVKCKDAAEYDKEYSQKQWKPSKEQIIELHRVISGCSYDIDPLVEIEKHLKKLMEE